MLTAVCPQFRQAGLSSRGGESGETWQTLPQLFKNHGYVVLGHGKVFHPNKPPKDDEPHSWSPDQPYVPLTVFRCDGLSYCPGVGKDGRSDEAAFSDFNTTMSALHTLHMYSKRANAPFFIALGLKFPHGSWATPRWTARLYEHLLPAPAHPHAPAGSPDIAFTAEKGGKVMLALNESNPILATSAPTGISGTTRHLCPSPQTNTVPQFFQQQLRAGYYSAVTHTDWLFGKVLDKLDLLGLRASTLVVVNSDHGYQLGEHGEWGKHTNWELAVQVPLLIRAPWLPASTGQRTGSYTELVDLYRTIAALAGLPDGAVAADVDGTDVSALLHQPGIVLKNESYAQYPRCPGLRQWPHRSDCRSQGAPPGADWCLNNCEKVPASNLTAMGYTVRVPGWRLTEWFRWNGDACVARFDAPHLGLELYAHDQPGFPLDFDAAENENLAEDVTYAAIVAELRKKLRQRFDTGAALGCPPPLSAAEAALSPGDDGFQNDDDLDDDL